MIKVSCDRYKIVEIFRQAGRQRGIVHVTNLNNEIGLHFHELGKMLGLNDYVSKMLIDWLNWGPKIVKI